jgi:hypothetical protein
VYSERRRSSELETLEVYMFGADNKLLFNNT